MTGRCDWKSSRIGSGTRFTPPSCGTCPPEAEALHTDAFLGYKDIDTGDVPHREVNHVKEWVVGNGQTNGVEGVWSLLNRSNVVTFHKAAAKHLDRYLDGLEWCFKNRHNPFISRDVLVSLADGQPLRYHTLTG